MTTALPATMMIADLTSNSFSSVQTIPGQASGSSAATSAQTDPDGKGGSPVHLPPSRLQSGEIRPMRWLLPWLWQLSQTPVEAGEPIEWEVELPEGDRLRLHAMNHYGEWILDFAGSSHRLQRWLGNHSDELATRLQRIIGKPVRIHIDPNRSLQTAS